VWPDAWRGEAGRHVERWARGCPPYEVRGVGWAPRAHRALQEQLIHRISGLVPVAIAQRRQELPELVHFPGGHLQPEQRTADVAALVPVMEQRNVPVRRHA